MNYREGIGEQVIVNEKNESGIKGGDENTNGRVRILLDLNNEHEFHNDLMESLNENLIGQDKAKKEVTDLIVNGILSFRMKKGPIGTLFFSGPTGVGKTEMIRALAKSLFGNENAYTKISCENYQESHTATTLFGAPKSYLGYGSQTPLHHDNITKHYDTAKKLGKINSIIRRLDGFGIILFDEIEKAHPDVHQSLLGLLDDGRIDFPDGTISKFNHSIIIFTSNVGEQEINETKDKKSIGFVQEEEKTVDKTSTRMKKIKQTFSPEFIGRIGAFVEFEPLTKEDVKQIVDLHIKIINVCLLDVYRGTRVQLKLSESVYDYLIANGYSGEKGAREIVRTLDRQIEHKINIFLNSEEYEHYLYLDKDLDIFIDCENDDLKFYAEYNQTESDIIGSEDEEGADKPKKTLGNKPLNKIHDIFSTISVYVEMYYMNMEGEVDFSAELKEYEDILKDFGFTNGDIFSMRDKAYIESINDLAFISDFNGLNITLTQDKYIFAPYRKKDIQKVVSHILEENYEVFGQKVDLDAVAFSIYQKIKAMLKGDEDIDLSDSQKKELNLYIAKAVSDLSKKIS